MHFHHVLMLMLVSLVATFMISQMIQLSSFRIPEEVEEPIKHCWRRKEMQLENSELDQSRVVSPELLESRPLQSNEELECQVWNVEEKVTVIKSLSITEDNKHLMPTFKDAHFQFSNVFSMMGKYDGDRKQLELARTFRNMVKTMEAYTEKDKMERMVPPKPLSDHFEFLEALVQEFARTNDLKGVVSMNGDPRSPKVNWDESKYYIVDQELPMTNYHLFAREGLFDRGDDLNLWIDLEHWNHWGMAPAFKVPLDVWKDGSPQWYHPEPILSKLGNIIWHRGDALRCTVNPSRGDRQKRWFVLSFKFH